MPVHMSARSAFQTFQACEGLTPPVGNGKMPSLTAEQAEIFMAYHDVPARIAKRSISRRGLAFPDPQREDVAIAAETGFMRGIAAWRGTEGDIESRINFAALCARRAAVRRLNQYQRLAVKYGLRRLYGRNFSEKRSADVEVIPAAEPAADRLAAFERAEAFLGLASQMDPRAADVLAASYGIGRNAERDAEIAGRHGLSRKQLRRLRKRLLVALKATALPS